MSSPLQYQWLAQRLCLNLVFLSIYIAIGQNIRNVQNFPKHESESYVWAPVGNPTFLNEQKMRRIFDKTKRDQFWQDYNNELDPGIQAEMLFRWEPSGAASENVLQIEEISNLKQDEQKAQTSNSTYPSEQRGSNLKSNTELGSEQNETVNDTIDACANNTCKTGSHEMFLLVEAKRPQFDSLQTLLTVDHFREMIAFEEWLLNIEYPVPPGNETANLAAGEPPTTVKFKDLCRRQNISSEEQEAKWTENCETDQQFCGFEPGPLTRCWQTPRPLDFIYDRRENRFALEKYRNDDDIVKKVQTGKGDEVFLYNGLGRNIFIEMFFGGTTPRLVKQDYIFGSNDLISAKAYRYIMRIDNLRIDQGYTDRWKNEYELWLYNQILDWSKQSKYLDVKCFSYKIWEYTFIDDVIGDGILLGFAVILITTYSFFVLGNCSPVHMRGASALIGIGCVIISLLAGYGLAAFLGFYMSRMHNVLPFLMLGLGVDDMFVIVNSIDQTPIHLSANERFRIGFTHAGPSITITSVTDGLAFFLGSLSTMPALGSFCISCGICVATLYIAFLTIYSPWFYEDFKRMHRLQGDCCGICCCKDDSILCCRGYFLTKRLREFSKLDGHLVSRSDDPDVYKDEYASYIEEIIAEQIAPETMTSQGRIVILLIWALALVCSVSGILKLEMDFSMEYFIPRDSILKDYLDKDIEHFGTGYHIDIQTFCADIDLSSEESQLKILEFYERVSQSYLCQEQWFVDQLLWDVWYQKYNRWVRQGKCIFRPEGLTPFEKIVPPEIFYLCFNLWREDGGKMRNVEMSPDANPLQQRIYAYQDRIRVKRIVNASTHGVGLLLDLRYLEKQFAVGHTWEYQWRFYDYEQYFVLVKEFAMTMISSVVAVLIVILVISSNFMVTALVAMCIVVTDVFLTALIYYWNLTFNFIVIIQLVLAIGTAVDFSAHIAYHYLIEPIPEERKHEFDTNEKIRIYKAQMALSKMGSSVFHGGFSTFVALSALQPSKTYVFIVFYRLWFGIIIFGMANGFFLLPVVLSYVGPIETGVDPAMFEDEAAKVTNYDLTSSSEEFSLSSNESHLESESSESEQQSSSSLQNYETIHSQGQHMPKKQVAEEQTIEHHQQETSRYIERPTTL